MPKKLDFYNKEFENSPIRTNYKKLITDKGFQEFAKSRSDLNVIEMVGVILEKKNLDMKYMETLWLEINRIDPNISGKNLWEHCVNAKFNHEKCDMKKMYDKLTHEVYNDLNGLIKDFLPTPEGKKMNEKLVKISAECREILNSYRKEIQDNLTQPNMEKAKNILLKALEKIDSELL